MFEDTTSKEKNRKQQINAVIFVIAVAFIGFLGSLTLFKSNKSITTSATNNSALAGYSVISPSYDGDFADPSILKVGNTYYGYATQSGFTLVPGLISTNGANWQTNTANIMPSVPSWANATLNWAPSVSFNSNLNKYVMFYTVHNLNPSTQCIGEAMSSSPSGPFIDTNSGPFICQTTLGGSIDPSVFTDANGASYIYWKNDGNSINKPSSLWVQPLDANYKLTGTATSILASTQIWQNGIIEGPNMTVINGKYYLFYGGSRYYDSTYAIGYATCTSAIGPCTDSSITRFLGSMGDMYGPGSPEIFKDSQGNSIMAFAAWHGAMTGSTAFRALYEVILTSNAKGVLNFKTKFVEPGLSISTHVMSPGQLNSFYKTKFKTVGGTGPVTYTVESGSLPKGLSIDNAKASLTGVPISSNSVTAPIVSGIASCASINNSTLVSGNCVCNPGYTMNSMFGCINLNSVTAPIVSGIASCASINNSTLVSGNCVCNPGYTMNSMFGCIKSTLVTSSSYQFTIKATDSSVPAQTATQSYSMIVTN